MSDRDTRTRGAGTTGEPESEVTPRRFRRFPEIPIDVLIEDVCTRTELLENEVHASIQDARRDRERLNARLDLQQGQLAGILEAVRDVPVMKGQMTSVVATVGRVEDAVFQLVAITSQHAAKIAHQEKASDRGSKSDEFMQKAAEAHLAVETAKQTTAITLTADEKKAAIDARKKRNAALVKIAIAFGSALALGLSSLITWALTR